MKWLQVAGLAGTMALATVVTLGSQEVGREDEKPLESGIFVQAAGDPIRLPSSMFDELKAGGMMKMMLTQGISKGSMTGILNGTSAETRVPADAAFVFQFQQGGRPGPPRSIEDVMNAAMSFDDGGIPQTVDNPKDITLVKFSVKKDTREANLGQAAGSGKSKDAIEYSVEALGGRRHRIKPNRPLAAGEYAFVLAQSSGNQGQCWDFGVDK